MGTGLIPAAVLALLASSGPTVSERTEFYDVRGSTAQNLRSEMDRLGPRDSQGRRFDAFTKWDVHWRYEYAPRSGGCAVTVVETSVEVVTTLPRWAERSTAKGPLVEHWDAYMRALIAHEKAHSAIGIAAAQAIHDALSRPEPHPTCRRLEEVIAETAEGLLQEHTAEEADYDRRTRNGMREGAVFP